MAYSNDSFSIVNNNIDDCQNPSPCPARQYLMCPHCSFHLCSEHNQLHQKQIHNQILSLHDQTKHLEDILHQYQPVQSLIEQVFHSLDQWKQKMHRFIDHYSEQIQMHIEQAQHRLNDQWKTTKDEYLQVLHRFVREPLHRLLKGCSLHYPFSLK